MQNPFGDDPLLPPRTNPFEDDDDGDSLESALRRIEHAGRKVRQLQAQLGAEGLTLSASRQMMTEIGRGFDAVARALRQVSREK
jgi:hypothetical protein